MLKDILLIVNLAHIICIAIMINRNYLNAKLLSLGREENRGAANNCIDPFGDITLLYSFNNSNRAEIKNLLVYSLLQDDYGHLNEHQCL